MERPVLFFPWFIKSRGVFVGVNPKLGINVERVEVDLNGHYIILQYKFEEQRFLLATIYAPNKDNPSYFATLFEKLNNLEGSRLICGDFNVALVPTIDRYSEKGACSNNKIACEVVNNYMEESLLVDLWRVRNPDKRLYTYRRKKPRAFSHIDYFLVDQAILSWIPKMEINPGLKSDHSSILQEILTYNVGRGLGVWKLNNKLLADKEYVDEINTVIDKMESVKLDNPNERWDEFKLQAIKVSQSFAKKLKVAEFPKLVLIHGILLSLLI